MEVIANSKMPFTIAILVIPSILLGYIKFSGIAPSRKGWSWQLNFVEFWNCFVNFLISSLIGYYFVIVKWPLLISGKSVNTGDTVLFILFTMGLFGHLNVLSLNITEGIKAIIDKYFKG